MKTRIIKQVTDSKGRITKDSYEMNPATMPPFPFLEWRYERLKRHLAIRNWIIVILIVINLLSWSH